MSDESLTALMAIVESALELPVAERDALLEERCGADPELLARARRVLATAAEPVGEGLGRRIAAVVGDAAASVIDDRLPYPERIGPYTVTGVLGEGGMGVVLAARQDEPVSREVAIKLIRAGAYAPRLVERFHAERQTLATLEHPDIARLYDAGTTREGVPFFVMERIHGEPFHTYCDRVRLHLTARLRLFRVLLGAVAYAHQKTIVHRDLKPSNVLVADVDGRPVLKVIDFGIARVASGDTGVTGLTGLGGGFGTIEYTSPEQLLRAGHGADTRSDVYSLGVILHELVTGRLPVDPERLRSASPTELERMLLNGPLVHPSRRITEDPEKRELAMRRASDADRLPRRIRGDLDTIIETALAGDPSRRYASVARLDEDIERFLDGRPITARPRTVPYRLRKFVGRNRVAVAGSVLTFILIAGMAILFTLRLADARDRAQLEADRAREIAGFLQSLFEVADPATPASADMTATELLDVGAGRIEGELAGRPDLQASLFAVVGRTFGGLGRPEEAETYLSRALALERMLHGDRASEVAERLEDLGRMFAGAGHLDRADSILRQALDLRMALHGPGHPSTAAAMTQLAVARRGLGDYAEAEALATEAVAVLRRTAGSDRLVLAHALHTLAFTLLSRASPAEAEPLYREALAIRRELLDPAHPEVTSTMGNLALSLEAQGRYAEAEALLREVVTTRRERFGAEHPRTLSALNNHAYMIWRTGDYPRAMERFEEVVDLAQRIHGGDHPGLAIMLNNLGVAQRRAGALAQSEATHRAAIAMNRRLFGDSHPRIAGDMDNLGRTLLARGGAAEAERLHAGALAMRTELLGDRHPDRAESIAALGEARLALGSTAEGLALLVEAVRIRSGTLGPDHARTGETQQALGVALFETGNLEEAENRLREALRVRRVALGDGHPDVAETLTALGRLLREDSRAAEADEMLAEARAVSGRRINPPDR
jgi:serine/threonine protein kinase/tetratricopeptide (TPR) repeat protein